MALTRINFIRGLLMKKEFRTETGRLTLQDDSGKQYEITCTTRYVRQDMNGSGWTPWLVDTQQFMCGRIPVNPQDDGSFVLAIPGTRLYRG
jgi:hypothetical protein